MGAHHPWEDVIPVPVSALRLPLELPLPPGFDAAKPESWPRVDGALEFVGGRLLYMPPTGEMQSWTCSDVLGVLHAWARGRPDFVVGANEAGVHLGRDVRAADAAVWRGADVGAAQPGYARVAPVLAVEVAGRFDDEAALREKARWYLDHGVSVVWLLLPATRRVIVLTPAGEQAHGPGDRLAESRDLPGLTAAVDDLFRQVSR